MKDYRMRMAWLMVAGLVVSSSSALAAGPPVVSGITFGPASSSSLPVSGTVVPNGFDTLTWFRYGTNTSYGNISTTNWLPGTALALSLNGSNQNGTVPGLGTRLPANEITVEFWQFAAEARQQATFTLNPDQFTNRFTAIVPWSDGNVYWDYGNITTSGRLEYIPPADQPATGSWQHFAFVASQSAGQMSIYRNGLLVTQRVSSVSTFVPNAADFLLGSGTPTNSFFKGSIGEFRIWNTALDQATIQAWMSLSVTPAHPAYANLAVYWPMHEGGGNVLYDFYAPQNDVLLNNSPGWTNGLPLSNPLPVSVALNGLLASTTYHVQLVASNSAGVVVGPDSVFNTLSFSNITAGLPPLWNGSALWGDFDNDGHLDVLLTGQIVPGGTTGITELWRNLGNGTFSNLNTGLPGVSGMALAGDFDNDGYLDILLAGSANDGSYIIQLWRNLGNGTFTNLNVGFPPLAGSAVACGDFNNDGLVDVLITGLLTNSLTPVMQLWQNLGHGSFTNVNVGFPGVLLASLAVGDFDNDGNLDFALTGSTDLSLRGASQLWRNLGNGTFSNLDLGLPALVGGSATWVDSRNSGLLDLLLNGLTLAGPYTQLWRNTGTGTLTNSVDAGLPQLEAAAVATGDFNGDGVPDVFITGNKGGTTYFSQVWTNRGDGIFGLFNDLQPGLIQGAAGAADFDGDGRLDLLVQGSPGSRQLFTDIYRKLTGPTNTPPSPPSRLNVTQPYPGKVVLSWDAGMDVETTTRGLSYNVRVGSTPGGVDILSPLSDPVTGVRRVAQIGNAQKRLFTVLNLPTGTVCYWSVQTVDASYAGSAFAPEERFVVGGVSVASTGSASQLTPNSALLSGSAIPNGFDATAWFLWGPSIELTNSTPAVSLGNGTDPVSVNQTLTGLQPGTTYYYQLVATNLYGAGLGTMLSFVTPTNSPPTLSDFANLVIAAGTTSPPIPFVIGDAETAASNLVVSVLASDANLIPPSGLVVSGSGSNRTLTITPAAGETGLAAIVVLVSDGSLAVTAKSFVVTVGPASFTGVSRQPGGILLQGTGITGQSYTLQVSTNLVNWTALTNLAIATNGAFQFFDPNPTAPARFYRLSYP